MKKARSIGYPESWSWPLKCVGCDRSFPEDAFPFRCAHCGGPFDLLEPPSQMRLSDAERTGRGLERFRSLFPIPPGAPLIGLGEGGTPLVAAEVGGRTVHFKCEHLNPTGSFKDRGTVVLVSALLAAGVEEAVEDSSGNAGASFAAYAARAGIKARVYVPDYASGPKRAQMVAYGARVVPVPGPRSAASDAVRAAAAEGAVYASHAYLPFGLAGMMTAAYEIVDQLGCVPGVVITPVGQGSMLLGLHMGFRSLALSGQIPGLPKLVGVQARACAPIWALFAAGRAGLGLVTEGDTVAEGIRTARPVRGDSVLSAIEQSDGMMVAVDEEDILAGRGALAERGFYVEPTSAVIWPALMELPPDLPDPIVVILTGSGFKSPMCG